MGLTFDPLDLLFLELCQRSARGVQLRPGEGVGTQEADAAGLRGRGFADQASARTIGRDQNSHGIVQVLRLRLQ